MQPAYVLYYTGYHMLLLQQQRMGQSYRMTQVGEYIADESGLANFRQAAQQRLTQPVKLIVDIIEEDFRVETVPHLYGRNRRVIQQRYLNKFYADQRYTALKVQGQQQGQRREDITLLSAITNDELLTPWLRTLHAAQIPLQGLYSLPVVCEHLLTALSKVSSGTVRSDIGFNADMDNGLKQSTVGSASLQPVQGPALVISQNGPNTMRQSFYQQGQLKLSRLASVRLAEDEFDNIGRETERTIRFLENQLLFKQRQQLNVYIIAPAAEHGEWMQRMLFIPGLKVEFVDQQALAHELNLSQVASHRYNAAMFAHVLLRHPQKPQYQQVQDQFYYRQYQYRRYLNVAALMLGIMTVGLAGYWGLNNTFARQQLPALTAETERFDQLYAKATEAVTDLDVDVQGLEAAVTTVEQLQQSVQSLTPVWQSLSQTLQTNTRIRPTELRWYPQALPQQIDASTLPDDRPVEAIELKALVQNFNNNPRLAVETVLQFASQLRTQDHVLQVTVQRMPFDIAPNARLTGQTIRGELADQTNVEFDVLVLAR